MDKRDIDRIVERIKESIKGELQKKHYDNALNLIKLASAILYKTNLVYTDDFLEDAVNEIARNLDIALSECSKTDVVIYYDGFGLNNRGLVQIYLKALCKIKKVVYVTYSKAAGSIPDIINILDLYNGECVFLNGKNNKENIYQLNDVISKSKAAHFFFYSLPDDVVGTCILNVYNSNLHRYQINLTDHAFWLGAKPIDTCIDFRDYGAFISREYRKIPEKKIVCIPFYPIITNKNQFEGFPFKIKKNYKVVFSGGALYKTLGDDNKYYQIVRNMLEKHEDVIFWYAGSGDDSEMIKIINEFPGRAYLTEERKDLFGVIQNCSFYLSTYPVCGGLMFQYVASAGKIPVTLKNGDITNDFLLNQNNLGIEFNSVDEVGQEIDRLLNDNKYRHEKEKKLGCSVISPEIFDNSIAKLFAGEYKTLQCLKYNKVETEEFRQIYWENTTEESICNMIAKKDYIVLMRYIPTFFMKAIITKLVHRVKG